MLRPRREERPDHREDVVVAGNGLSAIEQVERPQQLPSGVREYAGVDRPRGEPIRPIFILTPS